MIRGSLERFGPGRSIVVDGKNIVRAGNGTLAEAEALGFQDALVIEPGPDQLVVVKRSGWTESEAQGYGIADNQSATAASWEDQTLAETIRALESNGIAPALVGFAESEVDALFKRLGDQVLIAGGITPDPPSRPPPPIPTPSTSPPDSTPPLPMPPPPIRYEVVIDCDDVDDQERVHEELTGQGYQCRKVRRD